jgi:hypothetical protein
MKKHHLFPAAFALGALAVLWVAAGFVGTNLLALAMTVVIGAVYAFGAYELVQFRRATATLDAALAALPARVDNLHDWLATVHPSLRNPVRLRIEGERVGLPGPALTPYLAGLLVMLGMLGTFVGMVVTFNGAVFALDGSTDLASIRAALAAPIKGLGLAFGTSVAGVAASAMLGLMAALARRERMQAGQALDGRIATVLRGFSLTHQRQETFKALQSQAQALPQVVDRMQAMMAQLERMSQQLNERLLQNQEGFHGEIRTVYGDLARAVDNSLRESLMQGAQAAGESIRPVVEAAMTGIAQDARVMHERVVETAQRQLDGLAARFDATAATVADTWTAALASHERGGTALVAGVDRALQAFAASFEQRSAALLAAFGEAYAGLQAGRAVDDRRQMEAWQGTLAAMAATLQNEWRQAGEQTRANASDTLGEIARLTAGAEELMRARAAAETAAAQQHDARMAELTGMLRGELGALRDAEARRGDAAVARLGELQAAVADHLTNLGTALEAPIARLMETAAEAPRAAAEVIGQLRQEISHGVARDNALLEERARILETLNGLLDSIRHASTEQRATIDALVASSAVALDQAGGRFAAQVGAETARLAEAATQVAGGAVEVASLGDAFGAAVQSFGVANEKLIDNLRRIETALDKSMVRSEEQLAYYVAQAREVIDLSILSQKEIFDALRQLPGRQAALAAGAN